MRVGENPTKFARHNKSLVQMKVRTPEALLAATVVYIPRLTDYYADSLNILKASLRSLQQTVSVPFDLLVYDNGSCPEVLEYLQFELAAGRIQWLWLSDGNMKKIGAWNHIFGAAQSDFVYYFDCDILHRPGWFERSMEVFEVFEDAGIVNAAPIPMKDTEKQAQTLSTTLEMLARTEDVVLEKGNFTSDAWFLEFGESLGADPEKFLRKARRFEQVKACRGGLEVFVQVWHAQFLARTAVLRKIFPQNREWAAKSSDHDLDLLIDRSAVLRLGITQPLVAHLGNTISPRYQNAVAALLDETMRPRLAKGKGGWLRFYMRLPLVRRLVLRLHALTFKLIYNVD